MADTKTLLESNQVYHIYNHAVGNELLFRNRFNYELFLNSVQSYLLDYMQIYCYCLLPNHFHLLVRISNEDEIFESYLRDHPKSEPEKYQPPILVSKKISHLFNKYAQSYNKEFKRKGSLFCNRFKRKQVTSEEYLRQLVQYIHQNPIHHGYTEDLEGWKYSSYADISRNRETFVESDETIDLFFNLENFKYCHSNPTRVRGPS